LHIDIQFAEDLLDEVRVVVHYFLGSLDVAEGLSVRLIYQSNIG
jgi:hypothetical protein